jgi:hypothetical protein
LTGIQTTGEAMTQSKLRFSSPVFSTANSKIARTAQELKKRVSIKLAMVI